MASDDILLQVERLTTVFPAGNGGVVRAVDDIGFTIARGDTVALVGESGCGKSVTALSIMRLVQPPGRVTAGRILFEGRDLLALSEREMQRVRGARISLVFQEPASALNPVFTIGDQVAEAMLVHGAVARRDARARTVALLDAVRIPDAAGVARAYPHQLSGGMRQRVLIAMALACRPALVIADEPTTALDVTIQAEILDLLREMQAAFGIALLLITHDLGVVAQMTNRVLVMYAGRIVEEAPVRTVFSSPAHPYTQGLLASVVERGEGRHLAGIDGTVPDLASLPPGCAFAPRCGKRLPVCAAEQPGRSLLADGHAVRCHLYSRSGAGQPNSDAEAAGSDLTRGGV